MDTTKHVVTVPIEDYNKMLKAQELMKQVNTNLKAHLDLLQKNGNNKIDMDLSKFPTHIMVSGGSMEGFRTNFNYSS